MNPKLLYVFYSLHAGGAERSSITVANYLAENKNYDVSFYVFNDGMTLKSEISPKIIIIPSEKRISKNPIVAKFQNYFQFGYLLSKSIKNKNYDIVIAVHEHLPEFALNVWRFLNPFSLSKNKLVLNLHFSVSQFLNTRDSKLKLLFHKFIVRNRSKIFTHIFSISNSIREELIKFDCNKVTTIYNPINRELIRKCSSQPIDISINKKYFVTVGTISERKDQLWLINSIYDFLVANNCKLIIIGRALEQSIHKKIVSFIKNNKLEEYILLTGELENPYNLIANSMGLLSASSYESFGYVQHESMVLGVPVVTIRQKETSEFYNESNCFLFERHNKNELIKNLEQILESKSNVESIVNSAEEYIKEFDTNKICSKFENTFMNLIKSYV